MNPSRNPSAIRSQNEITDTLLRLMKSYPYSEITVKQIILEAHIARKTFYRNFLSKDDVLDSYIDNIMFQYVKSLQQLEDCRLSNILDVIFSFCMQNQELLFLLRDNGLAYLLLEKWNIFIPAIHDQIVRDNCMIFQSFSARQVSYIIACNVGAVWNVIMKWIEYDMNDAPEEIKNTVLEYLNHLTPPMPFP